MYFKQIFEEKLAQYAYLIGCQATGQAILIDPMRDIDQYYDLAEREELTIIAAVDTHIHADYMTGLREFAEKGVKVYASDEGDEDWKYEWFKGSDYNYQLLKDGDRFSIGNIHFEAKHTPGHTPEHISFTVTDGAGANEPMGMLTGDFIFVGDVGRPDLLESAAGMKGVMESSAKVLYQSVNEFKNMPEYWQIWPGHGAGSACGKSLGAVPDSTVGYELRFNPSIHAADSEQQFIEYILDGQPEPPLYFARMKHENRGGPSLLGSLPNPKKMKAKEIASFANKKGNIVVDTRERDVFMNAHLKGSLLVTLNDKFNTDAGSYLDANDDIYLVIEDGRVEEAVRDLVRIGLDNIQGYITPAELKTYLKKSGEVAFVESIDFRETAELLNDPQNQVLDVRKATEYEEGHIDGAVNIAHTRLLEREQELDKEKTWLVHCRSGRRASVAASQLKRDGFNVRLIDDHIDNWLKKVNA